MNAEIVGIGLAVVDHLMLVPDFPCLEGVITSSQYKVQGGGMVSTALVAAQKLGAITEFWGRVGDDEAGQFLLKELRFFGVNLSQVHVVPGGKTGICFVMVKAGTGERSFVVSPQRNLFVDLSTINLERIKKAKIVLVDSTWVEAAQQAAHVARAHGIPVVADVHDHSKPSLDVLSLADFAIIPRQLADVLAPKGDHSSALKELKSRNVKYPIVTLGGQGCTYLYRGKIFKQPAFQVEAIDTTGAGDAFHGAFCYALLRGLALPESVTFASAVAALTCTKLGGRTGIPTYNQTIQFMREQGGKSQ